MANISVKDGVICIVCKNDLIVEIHPDDSVSLSFEYNDGIQDEEENDGRTLDIDFSSKERDITINGHVYADLIAALIKQNNWTH